MTMGNRDSSAPSNLESRFIDANYHDKKELIDRIQENDLKDIQTSIEKYESERIPEVESDIQNYRQKSLEAQNNTEKQIYSNQLRKKIKERKAMRDALD